MDSTGGHVLECSNCESLDASLGHSYVGKGEGYIAYSHLTSIKYRAPVDDWTQPLQAKVRIHHGGVEVGDGWIICFRTLPVVVLLIDFALLLRKLMRCLPSHSIHCPFTSVG